MTKRIVVSLCLIFIAIGVSFLGPSLLQDKNTQIVSQKKCERIVSLAPSTTEMLFALGLEDNIVGVTEYCDYPPKVKEKQKIGGYADPNYELIFGLKPNRVVLLDLHFKQIKELGKMSIPTTEVTADSILDITNAIKKIGSVCGVDSRADTLVANINSQIALVKNATAGKTRPTVLISVGRSMGSNTLRDVFIAGPDTFFSEVVHMAGGQNVVTDGNVRYPRISAEGILALNPDVILDLVVNYEAKAVSQEEIISQWKGVSQTNAVLNKRVYALGGNYVVTPGPRVFKLVAEVAKLLHPDIGLD